MNEAIPIQSRDYWLKVIEMLQQNWALMDESTDVVTVYFISDTSGVFDQLKFQSSAEAKAALCLNGFGRYTEDPRAASFIRCPEPPFHACPHQNGPIYSSGRFWKT